MLSFLKYTEMLTLIYIRTLLTQKTKYILAVALCLNRSERLTWKNEIAFHIYKKRHPLFIKKRGMSKIIRKRSIPNIFAERKRFRNAFLHMIRVKTENLYS